MLVHGKHYRTIWLKEGDPRVIQAYLGRKRWGKVTDTTDA